MTSKAKTTTKLKRSLRAISPVLSVLMMIAIAVAASLVAYAWIMGYIGGTTSKVGKAVMIQSMAKDQVNPNQLLVFVQNVGQGTVEFDSASCVYVNDIRGTVMSISINPISEGQTATITVDLSTLGISTDLIKVKVVTKDGTFTETRDTISVSGLPSAYTLTLSTNPSDGSGGSVSANLSPPYTPGTTVQVTANPVAGWSFSGWSGDLSGTNNPETIVMNGHKTVTATFAQIEYPFTPSIVGSGSVGKNPDRATYHLGDSVQLTATPVVGWTFAGWSGDLGGSDNPATLIIDANPEVTATFTQNQYTLSVGYVGTGSGSVELNPPGGTYTYGTIVTLTANPAGDSDFAGWSGDLSGAANPETITIDGSKSVTATFNLKQYTLTVNTVGSGSVSRSPNQATYAHGTVVTLDPQPAGGWSFSGWSGDLTGSDDPKTITMDGNKAVTATFTATPQTITRSPSSYSDSGWSSETGAYSDGGSYATSDNDNEWIIYSGYGFTIPSGATITQVRVRLDAWNEYNDDINLEVYDGSWRSYSPTRIQLSTSQTTIWCDVTSLSSGGWTAAEVNGIQVRVTHDEDGSSNDDVYLDWIPIEVIYIPP